MENNKRPQMNYEVEERYSRVVFDYILLVFLALIIGALLYIGAGWVSKVITSVSIVALTIHLFADIQMLCIEAYYHGKQMGYRQLFDEVMKSRRTKQNVTIDI